MALTRRTILASLFFLLAMLIAFYAVAHFYLVSRYPTSVDYIKKNLGSPTFVEQFKVEEAKKHGYSEKEIAEYLAKRNSEKYGEYTNNIFLIEATIFVVSFLIGLGLIIMNPSAKKNDATLGPPVGTSHNEHTSTKKPISIPPFWQEISLTKLILFIMLLPAVVILLDIILSITFSKLSREISDSEWRTIAYILYFSLGIWIEPFAMSFFFGKRETVGSGTERKSSAQSSIYGVQKYSGRQLPPFFTFQSGHLHPSSDF